MIRHGVLWALVLVGMLHPLTGQVELRRTNGALTSGRLISISAGGVLNFRDGATKDKITLPLAEVVSLRFGNPPVSRYGSDSSLLRFEMAGGDIVYGSIIDGDFDHVRVESLLGRIKIPLDALERVVCLANASGLDARAKVVGDDGQDVLLVRSKVGVDSVHGSLTRFTRTGALFELGDGEETLFGFKKKKVASVSLAEPEAPKSIKGVHSVVFFRDGSRLTGKLTKNVGSSIQFEHATGATLELSVISVAEIDIRNGQFTHLSDLKPIKVLETPFLAGGLKYGLAVDQGIQGGPLSIGTRGFPRGLSVHTRCAVTFTVDPGWASFSSAIGVDGAVAHSRVRASINFSVLLDGKVVVGPTLCRAGEEPKWLENVDLKDAKTLTLVADFADNYHFNGWAVWGSPYFVMKAD